MARTELITNITKLFSQLSRQDIEVSVKVILDSIATRLAKRERVEIRGFGGFTAQTWPPRTGRNPKIGESVLVPEKSVPISSLA